jgi:hypothetical protein
MLTMVATPARTRCTIDPLATAPKLPTVRLRDIAREGVACWVRTRAAADRVQQRRRRPAMFSEAFERSVHLSEAQQPTAYSKECQDERHY